MNRHVTIRELARECQVGVTTVSRALNDKPGISATTKERIQKAARELGYRPNPNAQNLRAFSTKSIAVLVKGTTNPFFLSLLDPLEQEIRDHGYQMNLIRVEHHEDEVKRALQTCRDFALSGLIFMGGWFQNSLEELAQIPVPFVACTVPLSAYRGEVEEIFSVAVDDFSGMDLLVKHLADLGHQRIAFIGPDRGDPSVGRLRQIAFEQACEKYNLPLNRKMIINGDDSVASYSLEYGYQATRQLIESGAEFTALATITDLIAIGAMRALREHGLKLPEDMSVTGFDGLQTGEYIYPSLTTIVQPGLEITKRTCKFLFANLQDKKPGRHLLIPGELRIGSSSGALH